MLLSMREVRPALMVRLVVAAFLVTVMVGCATIRRDVPRAPSQAFERPEQTALGKIGRASCRERV